MPFRNQETEEEELNTFAWLTEIWSQQKLLDSGGYSTPICTHIISPHLPLLVLLEYKCFFLLCACQDLGQKHHILLYASGCGHSTM